MNKKLTAIATILLVSTAFIANGCFGDGGETCTPQDSQQCHNGDVYWYDSCGNRGDLVDACGTDETCENGNCVTTDGGTDNGGTTPETQNDVGTGGDAGNNITAATTITPDTGYSGSLTEEDNIDIYILKGLNPGSIISVEARPSSNLDLGILSDVEGYYGYGEGAGENPTGDPETLQTMLGDTSTFYFGIYKYQSTGTYTFDVSVETQDDAGSGGDITGNCDEGAYQDLTAGKTYSGHIGGNDGGDIYVMSLDEGQSITVEVTPQSDMDIITGWEDDDCTSNAGGYHTETVNNALKGGTETMSYTAEDGSHFFYWVVEREAGADFGSYDMQVTIE